MFRQIHCSLWREPWFEKLTPAAKLLFLYLISNGNTSPAGFLIISRERLQWDLGLTLSEVDDATNQLTSKVHYWPDSSLWWIRRFWHWQGKGPKWLAAVKKDIAEQPAFAQDSFLDEYPMDTLSMPHIYPMDTVGIHKEQDKEREQEQEKREDSAIAPSSPAPVRARVRKVIKPTGVGPDFEQRMVERFPMLNPTVIHEQTELALSHVNAKKYANTELYVQNWLRREAEQHGNNRGAGRKRATDFDNSQEKYERIARDDIGRKQPFEGES